jgi:hypothetical protein
MSLSLLNYHAYGAVCLNVWKFSSLPAKKSAFIRSKEIGNSTIPLQSKIIALAFSMAAEIK